MNSTDSIEKTVYTARFPNSLYAWLRREVEGTDSSLNDLIVQLAMDFRDCYQLPALMVTALEADRKDLGLGRREYILHILTRRYEQLLTKRPGFDGKGAASHRVTSKDRKPKR